MQSAPANPPPAAAPSRRPRGALLPALAVSLWLASPVRAQEPPEPPSLDWYYAAAWGTGAYRAGDRSVYVLRAPFSVDLPEPASQRWTARVLLPVSVGLVDFDVADFSGNPLDNVSSLLFTPGVEFTVPVGPDWTVQPFAIAGGGFELGGDDSALIASAGLHAHRRVGCGAWRCTLGVGITWAGYRTDSGARDGMSMVHLGLDTVSDLGPTLGRRALDLGAYAVYRTYLDSLDFLLLGDEIASLEREFELGLTLNPREPWRVFGYALDRVGLGFRFGRRFEGIRLVTTLPF